MTTQHLINAHRSETSHCISVHLLKNYAVFQSI